MSFINFAAREINCKIVYYGAGLGGKTTNLQVIYQKTADQQKGKMISLATETEESLAGPSGFHWYKNTRGEMHLINIRHIPHHTGQLSAFLRRVDDRLLGTRLRPSPGQVGSVTPGALV